MSWQRQEEVYLIMYESQKTGATYSELRKTDKGKDRLLKTLEFLGYDIDDVVVTSHPKIWFPELKSDKIGGKTPYELQKEKKSYLHDRTR